LRNNTTKKIINLEGKVIVKGYFNGISIIEIRNFRSYRKISDRYDSLYVEGISAKHRLERNNGKIVSFFDKD